MGKSPAKWVKNVLLRKKSSKSYSSKKSEKDESSFPSLVSSNELNANSDVSSLASNIVLTGGNLEVEQQRTNESCHAHGLSNSISSIACDFSNEIDKLMLEEATIMLQAALRAFMARRAYQSLRGIVKFQALIRGHLVRRQAAATLHCVRGIVKLQALFRGRMIRISDARLEVRKKGFLKVCQADVKLSSTPNSSTVPGKLSPNVFACKILASPVSVLPLYLHYDPAEPNSVSKWLERWSSSHFWEPLSPKKQVLSSITLQRQSIQIVGTKTGPMLCDMRRTTAANMKHISLDVSIDHGKAIHNSRKPNMSQQVETAQDHPQNELERVKRNLSNISLNNKEYCGKPGMEMPNKRTAPLSQPQDSDIKSKGEGTTSKPVTALVSNSSVLDVKKEGLADFFLDANTSSAEKIRKPGNDADADNVALIFEEQICKDANSGKNNLKSRRKFFPPRQEYLENAFETAPRLPSYMAATESAKAKFRGLALRGEDFLSTRRHSLSSSTNGKDIMRGDRSLTSSGYGHGSRNMAKKLYHLLCLAILASAVVDGLLAQEEGNDEAAAPAGAEPAAAPEGAEPAAAPEGAAPAAAGRPEPKVEVYEIKTEKMHAKFTNWGASLMSLSLPDKDGKMADVVLGYDTVDEYKNDKEYFGATVGRVANRIAGAEFTMDGKVYKLVANDGPNTLNGGPRGFGKVAWRMDRLQDKQAKPSITFSYNSFDGEEGFPGNLTVKVVYTVNPERNSLTIHTTATPSGKPTPVNIGNVIYWNLGGHDSGDILTHVLQIMAARMTPVDEELIPTGEIEDIKKTPYDFVDAAREVGSKIQGLPEGYDVNYALDQVSEEKKELHLAAVLEDPKSGRKLELLSNQAGLQFNSGTKLAGVKGKNGAVYNKNAGLCLEPQGFPDAVNHDDTFPSQIVKSGDLYDNTVLFKFSVSANKAQ